MNKTQIYIVISAIIIGVLFITNPNEINHKEAVKSKLKSLFSEKMVSNIENDENPFSRLGSGLGLLIGDTFIDKITEESIRRENYFLFSLTKSEFNGQEKIIGFGVLGNIFLSDKMDEIYKSKK